MIISGLLSRYSTFAISRSIYNFVHILWYGQCTNQKLKVGTTISSNVEASGRSSAHSNAYDSLNAIEDCTAPAAAQLGSVSSNFSTQSEISQQLKLSGDHSKIKEIVQERGWEGLASFIFGPDWFSIPLEGEEEAVTGRPKVQQKDDKIQTNGTATVKKAPGGKQILPARPQNSNNSTAISMASPKSGKGKQLSNMSATKERERSVSFSLDRQPSLSVVGADGGGTDTTIPSATNNRGGPITNDSDEGATSGRWHAPYLNTIPSFPLVSSDTNIANHRLSESKISMHDLATEMEACRETNTAHYIKRQHSSESSSKKVHPSTAKKEQRLKVELAEKKMREALRFSDDIYTSKPGIVWGSIKDSNTVNNNEKELVGKKSATEATKVKFDPSSTKPSSSAPIIRAPYVPNFLPPFPTDEYSDLAQVKLAASMSTESIMGDVMTRIHHRGQKRKASETNLSSDSEKKEMNDVTERDSVRRSVIGLGKSVGPSYWGSNWLDNDSGDAKRTSNNNTISLSGVTVAPGEKGGASPKKSSSDASQVLPLVRPSGSRLSKILEGSMT